MSVSGPGQSTNREHEAVTIEILRCMSRLAFFQLLWVSNSNWTGRCSRAASLSLHLTAPQGPWWSPIRTPDALLRSDTYRALPSSYPDDTRTVGTVWCRGVDRSAIVGFLGHVLRGYAVSERLTAQRSARARTRTRCFWWSSVSRRSSGYVAVDAANAQHVRLLR